MPTIIDNIELDESNDEFFKASELEKFGCKLIYLTGKAGTGKTTFLKYLRETTTKNTVILAPTGVAAINAGGQTIHSFFQIKPSIYVPNDKRLRTRPDNSDIDKSTIYDHFKYFKERLAIIKGLDLLVIDEISMVRCDLLDVIDRLLRVFRRRENEPFGGVQVILIGDTFQLAPIAKPDEWDILKQFYSSEFFFGSKVISQNKPVYIELKKIYRQNEQEFIELLNKVRVNQINQIDLDKLNSKYNPSFSPSRNSSFITLATHNKIVDTTNLTKLSELETELKVYEATITDIFPENIMPTDRLLQIKEGAQIMFIKNDKSKRFYNGKIAKINKLESDKIIAEFSDGTKISVEKEVWNNVRYGWNEDDKKIEEEIIGTFTQFPIKLAWAITVHKSQGLTFENVIADLGAAFTSGQVYVALSRCTTFNGLILKTKINRTAIITDPQVILFAQNETPNTLILEELNSGKADFYYKKSREAFRALEIEDGYLNLINAIKYRNDIETTLFKRHLTAIASRLSSYKILFQQSKKFEATNLLLKFTISVLQENNEKLELKNNEQNNSIKMLLEKTQEFEKGNTKLEEELTSLNKKYKLLSDEKKSLKEKLDTQMLKTNELGIAAKKLQKEIDRLNNLKWYQKLFNG